MRSPTTLKVCNLAATVLTGALFAFFLCEIPGIRGERSAEPAAAARPDRAKTDALWEQSRVKVVAKEWGVAAGLTRQLLDEDPYNPAYILQLAEALGEQGRDAEAVAAWEKYMLVSPTPWFACPQVARARGRMGDAERELAALERCYRMAPQNTDVIFFLAREYEKRRRPVEAKALYQKGLEISPGYVDLRLGAGRMFLAEEEFDKAEIVALDVLTAYPYNTDALLLLGSAQRELGKSVEARAALERGVSLAPQYSDFQFMLGRLSEDEGLVDEALRWYRAALAIAPDRADALERVTMLEQGAR